MPDQEWNTITARCPAELMQRIDAAIAGIKAVNSASSIARADFIRQAVTDLCIEVERDLADIAEVKAAEAARQPAARTPVRERTRADAMTAHE